MASVRGTDAFFSPSGVRRKVNQEIYQRQVAPAPRGLIMNVAATRGVDLVAQAAHADAYQQAPIHRRIIIEAGDGSKLRPITAAPRHCCDVHCHHAIPTVRLWAFADNLALSCAWMLQTQFRFQACRLTVSLSHKHIILRSCSLSECSHLSCGEGSLMFAVSGTICHMVDKQCQCKYASDEFAVNKQTSLQRTTTQGTADPPSAA
jgi:hypothetical protein